MDKQTYSELLRDPRWQRKRLEVLQKHNFTCECCGAADETLHVHHGYYEKDGRPPWDYPLQSLHCLCESCHEQVGASQDELRRLIGILPPQTVAAVKGYVSFLLASFSIAHKVLVGNEEEEVLCGLVLGGWGEEVKADYLRLIRDGVITFDGTNYEISPKIKHPGNGRQ